MEDNKDKRKGAMWRKGNRGKWDVGDEIKIKEVEEE